VPRNYLFFLGAELAKFSPRAEAFEGQCFLERSRSTNVTKNNKNERRGVAIGPKSRKAIRTICKHEIKFQS
jgi:hypothetical protein